MATIYEEVAALKEQMAQVQTDIEQLKAAATVDSGWLNLPLAEGIVSYAGTQIPQCRRIDDTVYVRGAVKNVLGSCVVGVLPEGFRPTATFTFIQNTSIRTGNFPMFARYTINSAGEIKLEAISDGASFGETRWFPIMTAFTI